MSKLYELVGEGQTILDMIEDEEVSEDAVLDTMEGWEAEYNDKVEAYLQVLKTLEYKALAYDAEIKRMTANKRTLEHRASWLRSRVFESMKQLGYSEAGGETIKCKIRKNGGKLPLIIDVDDEKVPREWTKTIYAVDKDLIREVLEAGNTLDFAHLGERGESLVIK